MKRCKHGMIEESCALCNPVIPVHIKRRTPSKQDQDKQTPFGASAIPAKAIHDLGFVIVRPIRNHHSHDQLDKNTRAVHIQGFPLLWLIKLILERAPNVKKIQVIPSMMREYSDSKRELCEARGIEFVSGHIKPEAAWAGGEARSPHYDTQRKFFLSLQGEQKQLWEELLAFGFEAAVIAARYFCLNGEDFLSQRLLCDEFGLKAIHGLSAKINSILCYLDPQYPGSRAPKRHAQAMQKYAQKYRLLLQSETERQKYAKQIGVERLPTSMPLARLEIYEQLLAAQENGDLDNLRRSLPKTADMICHRFDLKDAVTPQYHTLQQCGQHVGGLTRQRAQQLEVQALEFLAINTEDFPSKLTTPSFETKPEPQRPQEQATKEHPRHATRSSKAVSMNNPEPAIAATVVHEEQAPNLSQLEEGEAEQVLRLFQAKANPHMLLVQSILGPALYEKMRGIGYLNFDENGIALLRGD